jgi:hypothetical protein
MSDDKKVEETTPSAVGSKGAFFAFLLGVLALILTMYITTSFLGFKIGGSPDISLYYTFRVMASLIIAIIFIPGSVFAERLSSQEKKRPFRPKNIILFSAFFMEVLAVILFLSFVIEFFLPNVDSVFLVPLFAAIGSVGMLSFGLTVRAIDRNPRTRKLIERAVS